MYNMEIFIVRFKAEE